MSDISKIEVNNTKYNIKDSKAREDIDTLNTIAQGIQNNITNNYYNKYTTDILLNNKADVTSIPDVSNFITKDVDDLTYYTKSSNLSSVATSGNYNDLSNKPTIPTKTSDLSNDSGFITKDVDNLTNYTKSSNLSSVATSGSYNDLSNKPTIPTKTSDLSNDSGFITNSVNNLTNYTTTTNMNNALSNKVDKTDYTDSGWVNITQNQGSWEYAQCRKIGKMVEIRASISSLGVTSGAVLTLPSGYAPSKDMQFYGACGWVTDPCIARWYIGTNGAITMDWCLSIVNGSSVTVNTWKKFCVTYMID